MSDSIELLGTALLDSARPTITETRRLAKTLRINLGWHYVLDVAWIMRQLDLRPGMTVLDAGAGIGILQWLLAERGVSVLSVDRQDRSTLSMRFRLRYVVSGLVPGDLQGATGSLIADARSGAIAVDAARDLGSILARRRSRPGIGVVRIHRADLSDLRDLADASVDHVVSLSSLEHNRLGAVPDVVAELWRCLRPGGTLVATVGAAAGNDWFHEPSQGWCFSEATLREAFGLSADVSSNYDQYAHILAGVEGSKDLRSHLAPSYFRSGDNGMPWGRWDPTYLSVGVRRTKPAT